MDPPQQQAPTVGPNLARVREAHVQHCDFRWWYPRYAHLTFPSTILPLPQSFVDYLLDDSPRGLFLPASAQPPRPKNDPFRDYADDEWYRDVEDEDEDDEEEEEK